LNALRVVVWGLLLTNSCFCSSAGSSNSTNSSANKRIKLKDRSATYWIAGVAMAAPNTNCWVVQPTNASKTLSTPAAVSAYMANHGCCASCMVSIAGQLHNIS
jgi:hypothetical protein